MPSEIENDLLVDPVLLVIVVAIELEEPARHVTSPTTPLSNCHPSAATEVKK